MKTVVLSGEHYLSEAFQCEVNVVDKSLMTTSVDWPLCDNIGGRMKNKVEQ